ncbi:MAG TPA: hypothetical protein PLM00_00065 [Spirochaetota bacterium]|nr:hypothetical protein [Spirochaetota bacterium]HPN81755.1 hypothetical protein [Spirochaetota bacterium]
MLVRLLTLFLFLACWAQTAFADSRATILSTPLTNDGDGKVLPVRQWFSGLALDYGLTCGDQLPQDYALSLPRIWKKGDTLGHVLGSACLLAGDLVYSIEGNLLLLKKTGSPVETKDLPGQRSSRPIQAGDVLLSVGPFIPLSNGFEMGSVLSDKRYEKSLYGDINIRLDWFFSDNFSVSLLLAFYETSIESYRLDTGNYESDMRTEASMATIGIDFWFNPQRDLGLLTGFKPFGEFDICIGLSFGYFSASPDGTGFFMRLQNDPSAIMDNSFFLTMLHTGFSFNLISTFFMRLDWYTGRLENILSDGIGGDFVNAVSISFVFRY